MIKLWGASKEEKILKLVEEQARGTVDAVEHLFEVYKALSRGDWGEALDKAYEVAMDERKVDKVREKIASNIFSGAWLPDFREAVMMLIEDIDNIADAAKDTARISTHRRFDTSILQGLEPDLGLYFRLAVKSARLVLETVSLLSRDIDRAVKLSKEIENIEVKVDEIKMRLLSRLYEFEDEVKILTLLQVKDIVLFLDTLVDKAEDFSDKVELVYLTFRA